jgi:hypothetical protein
LDAWSCILFCFVSLLCCCQLLIEWLGNAEGVEDADLVLLVTTRPTTGNTLAWAVACERDQWGRAIAGKQTSSDHFLSTESLSCC